MQIADGGTPSLTSIGLLVFNIKRNLNSPQFSAPTVLAIGILEIQDIGVSLQSVTAVDGDEEVGTLIISLIYFLRNSDRISICPEAGTVIIYLYIQR